MEDIDTPLRILEVLDAVPRREWEVDDTLAGSLATLLAACVSVEELLELLDEVDELDELEDSEGTALACTGTDFVLFSLRFSLCTFSSVE